MKWLLSEEGLMALQATLMRQPLLAFDFDGTLAPIVARPQDAAVPPAVALQLQRLSNRLPIAVISGRRVADVRHRLGFEPHFVVGNHGAEDPCLPPQENLAQALNPLRQQLQRAGPVLQEAGVLVEDKHYSIALHYRLAVDQKLAQEVIQNVLAPLRQRPSLAEESLYIFGGKKVVNVMAASAPNKADAVARLAQQLQSEALVFVGDDVNDEPVFERHEPGWLTAKVGLQDPSSKAQFYLRCTQDMESLLAQMLLHTRGLLTGPSMTRA
jgi:trehalose 6-phosphate phosphatase